MTPSIIALKLTLDALECPCYASFYSLCTNLIYLTQSYAHDMGYHFHSEQGAPVSDQLAQNFDALLTDLASGDRDHYRTRLVPRLTRRFGTLRPLFEPYQPFTLTRLTWTNLLARLAFHTHTQPDVPYQIPDTLTHLYTATDLQQAQTVISRLSAPPQRRKTA